MQSNRRKETMASLENASTGLRMKIVQFTFKAGSEYGTLQQEFQKEKNNKNLQTESFARLQATVQSLTTSIESLSSENEILRKSRINVPFMRNVANSQEALLAAQNRRLTHQSVAVRIHVGTTRRSLPQYRSKPSSDIDSGC